MDLRFWIFGCGLVAVELLLRSCDCGAVAVRAVAVELWLWELWLLELWLWELLLGSWGWRAVAGELWLGSCCWELGGGLGAHLGTHLGAPNL